MAPNSEKRVKGWERKYSDRGHTISVYANVVLSLSVQPPNPRYLAAWMRTVDELAQQAARPLVILTAIDSSCKAPDEESKAAIRSTIARLSKHIGLLLYVVDGHGFTASAMRSALSLIGMMARYPFPQKVFATANEAADWITGKASAAIRDGLDHATIVRGVNESRGDLIQLQATG